MQNPEGKGHPPGIAAGGTGKNGVCRGSWGEKKKKTVAGLPRIQHDGGTQVRKVKVRNRNENEQKRKVKRKVGPGDDIEL